MYGYQITFAIGEYIKLAKIVQYELLYNNLETL